MAGCIKQDGFIFSRCLDLGAERGAAQRVDLLDVGLHGVVLGHALLSVIGVPLCLFGHVEESAWAICGASVVLLGCGSEGVAVSG